MEEMGAALSKYETVYDEGMPLGWQGKEDYDDDDDDDDENAITRLLLTIHIILPPQCSYTS